MSRQFFFLFVPPTGQAQNALLGLFKHGPKIFTKIYEIGQIINEFPCSALPFTKLFDGWQPRLFFDQSNPTTKLFSVDPRLTVKCRILRVSKDILVLSRRPKSRGHFLEKLLVFIGLVSLDVFDLETLN